jgi:hypothetical protein
VAAATAVVVIASANAVVQIVDLTAQHLAAATNALAARSNYLNFFR